MPAKSEKQKRFFQMIRGLQTGKISPSKVSAKMKKAAKSISAKDAHDFATGKIQKEEKKKVLKILKEIAEPMYLNEEQTNPIAKNFIQKDIFDDYIRKFKGNIFSSMELESINNFIDSKPTIVEKDSIKYESNDQFNNNTTTVIKKLKEGNQFVYTSFSKYTKSTQNSDEKKNIEKNPESNVVEDNKDEISITKSISFDNDIKGGEILSSFLRRLDI